MCSLELRARAALFPSAPASVRPARSGDGILESAHGYGRSTIVSYTTQPCPSHRWYNRLLYERGYPAK